MSQNGYGDTAVEEVVKNVRDMAYKLQNKCHRPASALPPDFKKKSLKTASTILSWAFETEYVCPEDIIANAEKYTLTLNEALTELEIVEAAALKEKQSLCLAAQSDGTYAIQKKGIAIAPKDSNSGFFIEGEEEGIPWKWKEPHPTIPHEKLIESQGQCASMGLTDRDIPTLLDAAKLFEDNIKELDIRGNHIRDQGLHKLVIGLSDLTLLPNLECLHIGGNTYSPNGIQAVSGLQFLRRNLTVDYKYRPDKETK